MPGDSFLIVRFSAIGDCVMAAFVPTAIRAAIPNARLVWAVETRCRPVLCMEPMLNEVVDFPRDEWRRSRWSPRTWSAQLSRFARLRRQRFDFGIDLQGHSKTAICLRFANPKRRVSAFATDGLARGLNPMAPGDPDGIHRVERMIETARVFCDLAFPERPLMPSPISRDELNLPDGKLATISTGAGAVNKQYPASQWMSIAQGMMDRGYQVVFLGADSDPRIDQPATISKVGAFTLSETLSVVACSDIHLAADTGTGHIAAAYSIPAVSVFGPTDPALFRPFSSKSVVLRNSSKASDVTPEQILTAVDGLRG